MYTKEEEIIHFVFKAFKGMKRKKEDIELSFHSIMVGNMLKSIGCNENLVYIGYLHDIIEDTEYDYNTLLEKYGKKIADGVLALSENQQIEDYHERKKSFLEKLNTLDSDILLVELADKLQNLISDYDVFLIKGKQSLITESSNFEELRWYYISMQKLFNSKIPNNKLLERYNEIMNIYFN